MKITWPWRRAGSATARLERKEANCGGFIALHGGSDARWTSRNYAGVAREGYARNPVAHRCVKLISEAAAQLALIVMDGAAEQVEHPLLALLEYPNQRQTGAAFFEALYGHLMISGNAYVELIAAAGGSRELHLLRPDRVTVATDGSGWPAAMEHRTGNSTRRIALGASDSGGALQLTLFNPLDDHYGLAPLEAALMALDTHNAAGRWNKALLDNSARPSGALVYAPKEGGALTDDQFARLKAELQDGYQGPGRAGRPLILDGGLDWKTMGLTPRDMDFIEAKNAASRDIALALGVPPMLLGIPGDNTYANYAEANRSFYRLTVLPMAERIVGSINAWLRPLFGENLRLTLDPDQIGALSADRDSLWARVSAADFLTDDEKREAVGYGKRG